MDRILFGDNQFFGVNHLSEEKARQQSMRFQSLGAITQLLAGQEPVTMKTDWFELVEARLHLKPYTKGGFPSASRTRSGPIPRNGGPSPSIRACPTRTNMPTR